MLRNMRPRMAVAAFVLLSAPPALQAQRLAAPLATYRPPARISSPRFAQPANSTAPDYRWEGLAIGAFGGGLFGAYVGNAFCGADDTPHQGSCVFATIEGGLIGATVFGVVGGLLGTMFPKSPSPDRQAPP